MLDIFCILTEGTIFVTELTLLQEKSQETFQKVTRNCAVNQLQYYLSHVSCVDRRDECSVPVWYISVVMLLQKKVAEILLS